MAERLIARSALPTAIACPLRQSEGGVEGRATSVGTVGAVKVGVGFKPINLCCTPFDGVTLRVKCRGR